MSGTNLSHSPKRAQIIGSEERFEARDMFSNSIKMVEIEVFSYCNRRCWFCPDSTHDRITDNNFMDPALYTSILRQLAGIDYAGMISYSRYNEPFADRVIIDRIREARIALPGALLHTNSNGDYLDHEYLEEIYDAGLRSLNIQFYLKNHEHYDHEKIKKRAHQVNNRLNLPFEVTNDDPDRWYEGQYTYKDMKIRGYGRNFDVNRTSRGGEFDIFLDYVRTSPCLMPFWSVYVDYNGKIVPCCNFRSDIANHADYVVGDLNENPDLFLTYANASASRFRRSLLGMGEKDGLCGNCHFALESPSPADIAIMDDLVSSVIDEK